MSQRNQQQFTARVILGSLAFGFFIFVLGIYGGIKYLGAFGQLALDPPAIQKDN